uniref:uncharacterized protein LOC122600634 n=1 Tax=Erigeron canadensis TaxID=72917 RepID=UPI001CB8EC2C|nr:uncharacterized protein LOC122600634 [Erigeron canadensis]
MAEAQLLDDSALVKALDDAISKYKIMHIQGDNGSLKEERITKETEERGPDVSDQSNEIKSAYMKTGDNITNEPKNTTHTGEAADSSVTENCTSEVVEQLVSPSNRDQVDVAYDDVESAEHYNNLLNQYNAIEEQRQKVLEQLYQYGNWDYQGYGYDYGAAYDSQYNTVPAPQTSEPPVCSCRPYVYPTAQHTSSAAVPSGETCAGSTSFTHNGNSISLEDNAFIKEAMGAVEKAIRSATKESSGIPDLGQEGKKGQEVDAGSRDVGQHKTSETDLSVVLNAWFSAGFYTGKYLSEQASAKN